MQAWCFFFFAAHLWLAYYFLQTTTTIDYQLKVVTFHESAVRTGTMVGSMEEDREL